MRIGLVARFRGGMVDLGLGGLGGLGRSISFRRRARHDAKRGVENQELRVLGGGPARVFDFPFVLGRVHVGNSALVPGLSYFDTRYSVLGTYPRTPFND